MALTDNASSYATALATLAGVNFSPSQMVILIDAALVESLNYRADVNSYSIGGKSISTDRNTLKQLREYFDGLAKDEATGGSGMEINLVEF